MELKFGHIEIYVRDLERARRFYEGILGMEVTVEAPGLLWLQSGAVEFLLRLGQPPPEAARYEESRGGLVLYTEDLDRTAGELRGRGLVFRGTVDSEKCLTFTDPDGNWFQLVDPEDH